ncbi:barstar family protein [Naumannella halotolerans]|uniref:RNAse (Barnase) inhibitor barstar n=1 Tax=Naumannella halotolerans TaxID=993414 RepID=A0A4R7J8I0_9ACTN|nr:barstar family protein [Naumannella halotolerans]TDT32783.1 RNAse (barnase) inhibitor barstar [Naumannella halotolerans]
MSEDESAERHRLAGRQAGVYEVTTQSGVLPKVLAEWGWRVGVLRTEGIDDRRTLLLAIGRALDLPDWYGANLDALADCLTDLDRPTALVLDSWPRPTEIPGWDAVVDVLTDRVRDQERAAFALVMDRSG